MYFFFLWGGCRTYCEGLSSEEQCKNWFQVELLLHSYTVPSCVQDSTRFAIASFLESLIVDALFHSFRRVQDILWRTQFWNHCTIFFFKMWEMAWFLNLKSSPPSPCPNYEWFTLVHVQGHTYMWITRSRV